MLAALAMPGVAQGSEYVDFNYLGVPDTDPAMADGILAPGEEFDVEAQLIAREQWNEGGTATLSRPPADSGRLWVGANGQSSQQRGGFGESAPRSFDEALPSEATGNLGMPGRAFRVGLISAGSDGFQCGAQVPLSLSLNGNFTTGPLQPANPIRTGAAGATKTFTGSDYGKVLLDREKVFSGIDVGEDGRVKGVRVNIADINGISRLRWYKITLHHGNTSVVLWNGNSTIATSMQNLTFDDGATQSINDAQNGLNGVPDGEAGDPGNDDHLAYHDVAVQPEESLAAFDGAVAAGPWTIEVEDIFVIGNPRSGGRGRAAGRSDVPNQVGYVGEWTLGLTGAACNTLPVAWFDPEPLVISPDGGDELDGSGSADPGKRSAPNQSEDGAIVSYQWDLDGAGPGGLSSPSASPTIVVPAGSPRKQIVRLRVIDNDGNQAEIERTVLVSKAPVITPQPISPLAPQAGQQTTLSIDVTDPDPSNPTPDGNAGAIASIAWDMDGNGSFETTGDGTDTTRQTSWDTAGVKTVRVKVTDGLGVSTIHVFTINLSNQAPTAAFSVAPPVVAGQQVTLNAGASTDPDGEIVRWEWDFDGTDPFEVVDNTDALTQHTFPSPGVFPVKLRVVDDGGLTHEIAQDVTVVAPPTASASFSPTSPQPGQLVTFDASGSASNIVKYEWNLDGDTTFERETAGPTTTKSYANATVLSIGLRVTDGNGATDESWFPIVVAAPGGGGGGTPPVTPPVTQPPPVLPPVGTPPVDTPGLPVDTLPPSVAPPAPNVVWDPDEITSGSVDPLSGFAAKISAGGKQRVKKIVKKGIPVALTVNTPGKVSIKPVISVKDAKKLGLKIKKPTSLGLGRVTFTKAGKVKVTVKISKKFARYVKKAKKTPVQLQAVAVSDGGAEIPLLKKVIVIR